MNRKERRASRAHGAKLERGSVAPGSGALADLFGAAVARHQSGALGDAERQYRHILTLAPDHADSLHNLGLIALQAGDAAAAADLIGKAIKSNNRSAEYHYNIALAFRALNRLDDVAAHLERAVEMRSGYALAYLNLGNVRREQGRLADAIMCYERVITYAPGSAAAYFNLANILAEQGRRDEAIGRYQQALTFEPNSADAHGGLGTALLTQGKISEAVPHLERAVALNPNLSGGYENLGRAYLATGNLKPAIEVLARALEVNETVQGKALFGQCIKFAQFTSDDGRYRKLVQRALSEAWARPRELASVAINLIKLDGVVSGGIARANAAWPTRLSVKEMFGASELTAVSRDEFLHCLLECDPVTDIGLERLLTNIRHAMLMTSAAGDATDDGLLAFYCAVARQCFINEYVFSTTQPEADEAQRLRQALENALASGQPYPVLWPVIAGAYFPLHAIAGAEKLLERSWPQYVGALLVQQVEEPAVERRIAGTIPVLTGMDGEVSRLVRQQYEESPYPRWAKAGPPAQPAILFERPPDRVADVLIAGCGTGLSTIELARQARSARVLAVDLSLASLSYAKRMAHYFELAHLEFAQADILRLGSIGRQFDFIDVSGVLHHLADPWQGWRVLLSLLRPGGAMQVGLYSDLARRGVVAARNLIAERGYRPVAQDIRRCRENIIAAADTVLQSVTKWPDFFTTSECRDLLFHVQEHRITLPEIKAFLAANSLNFAGFVLDAVTLQKFAARNPDRSALTDLDRWHEFEIGAPDTFANMYLFMVHKPAA
jgi:tetratricopeptide (TPR) repeat protein/SAM-dependent methyltransferase